MSTSRYVLWNYRDLYAQNNPSTDEWADVPLHFATIFPTWGVAQAINRECLQCQYGVIRVGDYGEKLTARHEEVK